jgi:hypothetical protein
MRFGGRRGPSAELLLPPALFFLSGILRVLCSFLP